MHHEPRLPDLRVRRALRNIGTAVSVIAVCGSSAFGQAPAPPESPVKLYGHMERMGPQWNYTEADLQFIADHFDVVVGLDGHSYDFPGVIGAFRQLNADTPVLCSWDTMAIQPTGERFAEVDVDESVFLHSADPGSLRVVRHNGQTIGWFRRDARAVQMHEFQEVLGVEEYIVEYSDSATGAFRALGAPIRENGSEFYRFVNSTTNTQRRYRIRSRLSGGSVVDYSWIAQANDGSSAQIALGVMVPGIIAAVCYGDGCPTTAGDLILETDIDNDRVFGESDCSQAQGDALASCERWPFQTVSAYGDGGLLYRGTINIPGDWRISYKVVHRTDPQVRCPLQGSYQRTGYNNRIQSLFHSYLVWPDHPLWRSKIEQRLADCLAAGYDGMRLDFAFDTVDSQWIASGVPPDWTGPDDPRIADGVAGLLAELSASAPEATLVFNGFFSAANTRNYYRNLGEMDGAEFEFLGYGWDDLSTTLDPSTAAAMHGMWTTHQDGKWTVALAGHSPTNTTARLESLTLYLLLVHDNMYYFYSTDGPARNIPYFPEWDVPLGAPVSDLTAIADLVDPRGRALLSREFENGWVFFNDAARPVTVDLDGLYYLLSVTGGTSPEVGGDGAAHYTGIESLTIGANAAAIIVRQSPTNLSVEPSVCGNAFCESDESCSSCPADCGCDDGNACTVDSCNDETGQCEFSVDEMMCDDGDACTHDVCIAGVCSHVPLAACCGNGVCEPGGGEDCLSCPGDCNGNQDGSLNARFCCGDGGGYHAVGCDDLRCTENGWACSAGGVTSSDPVGTSSDSMVVCAEGTCNPVRGWDESSLVTGLNELTMTPKRKR